MWDALVPILWRSIPGRTSWDGVLPTLQQEARQLKAAVRLTCQKMGSNTRFSHFKEAFKGLTPAVTPARMVWLVLWEMLGRRVQILHCLGNKLLPQICLAPGQQLPTRPLPLSITVGPLSVEPVFCVPPSLPVLLENCQGHLHKQAFMEGLAHDMLMFDHCMHQESFGFQKTTCLWLSCFHEINEAGGQPLKDLWEIYRMCMMPVPCRHRKVTQRVRQGVFENLVGPHRLTIGGKQNQTINAKEQIPPGFCTSMIDWLLKHAPVPKVPRGCWALLCLFEGRTNELTNKPEGSWRAPCGDKDLWHIAVANNLETGVDIQKKQVQICWDLGPGFELVELLQELYRVVGLTPDCLLAICSSPPCKTYSKLDQGNDMYRDHDKPRHPVKVPGSTNWNQKNADAAHQADATIINLISQLPGLKAAMQVCHVPC